jgi:ABC-type glycerol-3-phosphate transport system permease component
LLKRNFVNVAFEIEQAAMMDGANLMQIMRNITLAPRD